MKNLLILEKYVLTSAKHYVWICQKYRPYQDAILPTSYFYWAGKIKVSKELLGEQDLCFLLSELGNYSLKSPATL